MSNRQHPVWQFIEKSPKTNEEQMFLEAFYIVVTHPGFSNMTVEDCWNELIRRVGQNNGFCDSEIQIIDKDGRTVDEHGSPVRL